MKKSCKIFSAVALSAVLAMGTAMPAFAVTDTDLADNAANVGADTNNMITYDKANLDANNGGASTNVNISTYSSNYSVTVPLYAPFMLDTAGGDGIAPTNYGIINGGDAAVFVVDVKWEMTEDSDWTFGDGTAADNGGLGSDAIPMGVVHTKAGTKPSDPTYGSFVITLSPENTDYNANTDTATYGQPVNTFVPAPTGSAANDAAANKAVKWVILCDDAGTTKDDESFNAIELAIKGSKLFKSLENIQTNVAAITYTVDSRAPETPTTPQP